MEDAIIELKRRHRRLYATRIGDVTYVWRPLGRREYRLILEQGGSDLEIEERLCRRAVLWPEGVDFQAGPAGLATTLAPAIRERSGFATPERAYAALAACRRQMDEFESQAEAVIAAAFPQIRFDEMADWSIDDLLWHLVRAEWVLKEIHGQDVAFRQEEPGAAAPRDDVRERGRRLREQGIDPMLTLQPDQLQQPFLDKPVIRGTQWQDEVILNGLRAEKRI